MTDESRPRLWAFAGPNGAGKSTLYRQMLEGRVQQINADDIARTLEGGFTDANVAQTGRMAVMRRKAALEEGKSLRIETTLAGNTACLFLEPQRWQATS